MRNFIKSMLTDERGATSSKRIIGFICAIILCACLVVNTIFPKEYLPSPYLIQAVCALASVCIVGSTIDKFSFKEKLEQPKTQEEDK